MGDPVLPRQNRVLPTGDIVRHRTRGLFMGNRGCLHDANGALGRSRWRSTLWIICLTEFNGRRRPLTSPGKYTELFFFDEAVALAAGHRPCGECRRADYRRFIECWAEGNKAAAPTPREMDRVLHNSRIDRHSRDQATFQAACEDLPDGVFVRITGSDAPHLIQRGALIPFEDYAYERPVVRPLGQRVEVLTPSPTVAALRAGYLPVVHVTAAKPNPLISSPAPFGVH
jgi:hypothetical protein